ncbi:MAG: FecR domain-containing protein [Elusimicrobia bacterium]|nr:FecR domain-containing protein [Elusimicrobiota bacterium]
MRTNILSLLLFIALPGLLLADEAKVLSMSGEVEVRPTREGIWIPAKEGMEIAEGGALRTGVKGGAVLLLPNKSKVWFRKSTTLEIEQRQTLASRLMLVFGKIKVRVPHLLRKEKFEVRNPTAICAVRGTEFTMGSTEDGKMDLQVLFGEVKLKFAVPPQKGGAEFNIPQGQGLSSAESGKAAVPVLLTAKTERDAMENWNPGLKPDERLAELRQKETDRAQIKDFARATNNAEDSVKSFLNVVKESDLEAGRTMGDVHGNVVRVDQRMVRPDGRTIQFMNLVKRPTYNNYSQAANGFAYNGGAVANRLDLAQMSMGFNRDLPARIEEWPSFFNSNDINPTYASFILANRTNAAADGIFFVAEGYRYDAARDELVDNLSVYAPGRTWAATDANDKHTMMTGVLKDIGAAGTGQTAQDMFNAVSRLKIKDPTIAGGADTSAGDLQYLNPVTGNFENMDNVGAGSNVDWGMRLTRTSNSGKGYSYDLDGGGAPLLQFQADPYALGNNTSNGVMWYARENYVIGNGGEIKSADSITSSSQDPFTLLKGLGVQTIVYVKQSQNDSAAALSSNAAAYGDILAADHLGGGRNIDIVFIPDLMVAAVQRMLPAITNLGD